jgi:hypothetical protein
MADDFDVLQCVKQRERVLRHSASFMKEHGGAFAKSATRPNFEWSYCKSRAQNVATSIQEKIRNLNDLEGSVAST